MELTDIIEALGTLIKLENTTAEDVFYNAGVIDCIKEMEKADKKTTLCPRSSEGPSGASGRSLTRFMHRGA